MKDKLLAIIPSRYASSRFEGKPLAMINQKPMVIWVYDAVRNSYLFDNVFVATDDKRILDCVEIFGGKAVMTSKDCKNGTERCNQVVQILQDKDEKYDIVVNIQGDEPLIKKDMMVSVVSGFKDKEADIVTLKKAIEKYEQVNDPNCVKVVTDKNDRALYFSRAAIPYSREGKEMEIFDNKLYYKHIGIYGYRTKVLNEIVKLQESFLENTEKLEQLRWLENGYKILVKTTLWDTVGVDTKQDLDNIIKIINKQ